MKRALILAAGLILPTVAMADVKVEVNIGGGHDHPHYETWYEECGNHGPFEESVEYQWDTHCGDRVLRFRTVTYHTISHAFVFGPWEMSFEYCYPGCRLHHVHNFYVYRRPYRQEFRGRACGKGYNKHAARYRYYRYDPPAREPRAVYRYEEPAAYGQRAPQYRSPEPVYTPPPPVRRPAVRPVPGVHYTDAQPSSQATVTRSGAVTVQAQEPARAYRPEQGPQQRSARQVSAGTNNQTTIKRTSQRVRVW